jgi:hypothetical protein
VERFALAVRLTHRITILHYQFNFAHKRGQRYPQLSSVALVNMPTLHLLPAPRMWQRHGCRTAVVSADPPIGIRRGSTVRDRISRFRWRLFRSHSANPQQTQFTIVRARTEQQVLDFTGGDRGTRSSRPSNSNDHHRGGASNPERRIGGFCQIARRSLVDYYA